MGEVVEVGPSVGNLAEGDRVVVPFTISCGELLLLPRDLWSLCDNSNPNAMMAEKTERFSHRRPVRLLAHATAAMPAGRREYVRVPFADVGAFKVPDELPDEKALFLTDIFPTGWMAAENCDIQEGDTVAVLGCGPGRTVRHSQRFPARAPSGSSPSMTFRNVWRWPPTRGAELLDESEGEVLESLREKTGGLGPDACIDAVGMEAHGHGAIDWYDKVKQAVRLETDRPIVLRAGDRSLPAGGTISIPGVYAGLLDKVPFGAAFGKGLTFRMGQTHVHRYVPPLLERILAGEIDPSFVITHRIALDDVPEAYETFRDKKDGCVKVVIDPRAESARPVA